MAYDLPQDVLKTILTTKHTAPERLSPQETAIAERICYCVLCHAMWVRRKSFLPRRCPKCFKPGWDRPFINALMDARRTTLTSEVIPPKQLKGEKHGLEN